MNDSGFERVSAISQLYLKRDSDGRITMIMAKVTDELLFSRDTETLCNFCKDYWGKVPSAKGYSRLCGDVQLL